MAEAWFQAVAITPGSSRKSRRFIRSTRRHGFLSGTRPLVRQMLALRSQRAAGAEAQFGSCRGPPGSALSSQAAPGADRAFSKRGLAPLHREAVEPSRDVHTCLLPMCAALPVTGAARILKPLPKGQSVKRVTLRMFLGMSLATIVVSYRLTAGLPEGDLGEPNYQLRRRILISPSARSWQPAIARRAVAMTMLRLTAGLACRVD